MKKHLVKWKTTRNNHMSIFGESFRIVDNGYTDVCYVCPTDKDNGNLNARMITEMRSLFEFTILFMPGVKKLIKEVRGTIQETDQEHIEFIVNEAIKSLKRIEKEMKIYDPNYVMYPKDDKPKGLGDYYQEN